MVPVLSTNLTDKLMIIGTALDGPTNTPVAISDLSTAIATFGPMVYKNEYVDSTNGRPEGARSGNDLVEAIERALAAGCTNIVAVRVPGERATLALGTDKLIFRGLFDGAVYNTVTVAVASGATNWTLTINQPTERGGVITLSLPGTTKLSDVVEAINNHPQNGTVIASTGKPGDALSTVPTSTAQPLANGKDGTRADRLSQTNGYKALYDLLTEPTSGTFVLVEDQEPDVVYLSCLYADDQVATDGQKSILPAFASFVHRLSTQKAAHGVLGARPFVATDTVSLSSYYSSAYLDNAYATLSDHRIKLGRFLAKHPDMVKTVDGVEVDLGRYVSVVIGMPCRFRSWQLGEYVENAAASFAGMLTTLSPAEISAFRTPRGVLDVVGATIPRATMEALMAGVPIGNGEYGGSYVVMRPPLVAGGSPIVANDITAAQAKSVFHYQSNVRIANAASKYLRQALIPFLGRPNTQETLTAMATAVRGVLNRLVEIGALLGGEGVGYRFTLEPSAAGLQTVEVRCVAELRPASFIRAITVDLTVSL